ncbi:type II toxin-antitoxin system YafQ family toxin (plasmid) [Nicoliella spurrieriana]|uniref:Type II toxin-antitoxin system YafQ family toxin n=1 Tax=Nicoliella spurrieriana TaxID=2925830 RepID=A0A976X4X7_9LACO|nr:type II toxin-antitoxin system YafQ family toxin [Nicoliella spurrieriana]UQS86219.1 type II toxin-antitoxin system YafQ family toxin [Nicoliella spurrieriana]
MKIKQTQQFERSLKKLSKKHYPIELISTVLSAIINLDKVILLKSKDHSLSNNWQ